MRIPRIFLASDLHAAFSNDKPVDFDETSRRHTAQVLRLKSGAAVILFDGRGGEFEAILTEVSKRRVAAQLSAFVDRCVESPLTVTLIQALSRGERMDMTLQKATELGVKQVVPVITERCGVHLPEDRQEKRRQHWQGIVTAACQQSGRTRLPTIAEIQTLSTCLQNTPAGDELRLTLDPAAEQRLGQIAEHHETAPGRITLLIGPEGGLTANEIRLAQHHGFVTVALGPRILRTETAGMTAIAVLQALWGDL